MKRRNFLQFSSILALSPCVHAKGVSTFEKEFKAIEATLAAVQQHMFPEGSKLPSASAMHVTQFVFETIMHESYDRDIKAFVLGGAKELHKREKGQFVSMTAQEKEKVLRAYEETNYGSNWLARIMTLTMEGMFCDPVYGSNVNEKGWKALGANGGFPRPKTRYMDV